MDNSFFIYTEKAKTILIERFHMCTWEFSNDSSLVEFGFEINKDSIVEDVLTIMLNIPWVSKKCETKDLYEKLSNAENSRFIFNDSINNTKYLKDNTNNLGIIHTFSGRNELCVLPATLNINDDKVVSVSLNLKNYRDYQQEEKPNIYFRFWIKPESPFISMRKKGISKSTIIYDIKINERRNIPSDKIDYFSDKVFCKIRYCFSFNILPNKYDIVFFDNGSLKNVRTLEYESFNKYLGDKRVKKDELIVVFNKKEVDEFEKKKVAESFSFFSIYSKERIGTGQFALAILINIVCGILLFVPAYKKSFNPELSYSQLYFNIPPEIYFALSLALLTLLYFVWPRVQNYLITITFWVKSKLSTK